VTAPIEKKLETYLGLKGSTETTRILTIEIRVFIEIHGFATVEILCTRTVTGQVDLIAIEFIITARVVVHIVCETPAPFKRKSSFHSFLNWEESDVQSIVMVRDRTHLT
jgi:hypothetical protein